MIGRDAELTVLMRALADGRAGHPGAVVVRGEAGIGKTRLLDEFRARAEASLTPGDPPLVVAVGQCVDLGPIGAPFTPIRRLVRDLRAAVGDEAFRAGARTPGVLVTLGTLVPDLVDAPTEGRDVSADYVAEAIETLLEGLSQEHHLLLVIEDLHWADASTMALLKTLATTLRGRHITLVATYRPDDVDRFHPLRAVLAELERNRGVVGIEVHRLTSEQVATQAAALGIHADERAVAQLAERSGGIPFLVEELAAIGAGRLPDTLRDLVLARYERLGDSERGLVRLMSAGGVTVSHDAIAAIAGLGEHDLDQALHGAIDARVLVADDIGIGYAFRHALTREAVHDDLLPSERARFHRAFAEHYAALPVAEPGRHAIVAEHWLAAGDVPRAFEATIAALGEAEAGAALATSTRLAERLIELWSQVPDAAAVAGFDRQELFRRAVTLVFYTGDYERMLRLVDEALDACPADDAFGRAWLLRQQYVGRVNALVGTVWTAPENLALVEEALTLLGDADDPPSLALRARTLSLRGGFTKSAEPLDPDDPEVRETVALAVASGDATTIVACIGNISARLAFAGNDGVASALFEHVPELPPGRTRTQFAITVVQTHIQLGRFGDAVELGDTVYAEAVRHGVERGMGAELAAFLAYALCAAGRPEEALRYGRRAIELLQNDFFRSFAVRTLATLPLWNDDRAAYDAVRAKYEALVAGVREDLEERAGWDAITIQALLADAADAASPAARRAAIEQAAALAESALENADQGIYPARLALTAAAMAFAAATESEVETGILRTRIDGLLGMLGDAPRYRALTVFVGALLREADGAAPAERVTRWREVVDVLAPGDGIPILHLHLARLQLAEALLEAGEPDAAAVELDVVQAEAPGHGVTLVARWSRELAERAGLSRPQVVVSAPAGVAALTPRELQVLELVAKGLTNPQIGAELFISPKTASVHVSAILAKIRASNRAEAASMFATATQR